MLAAAKDRFRDDERVTIATHDFADELPFDGPYDAIITSLAVHHVTDERKQELYAEIAGLLAPGGVFANLEHVSSPTKRLHEEFLALVNAAEDPSNQLLDVETQLRWLREIGFVDVECFWKWREMALLAGVKP
jgi:SAM-dependent methyltransferase